MTSLNIWELAKEKLRENQEKAMEIDEKLEDDGNAMSVNEIKRRHESVVIICGSQNCGKSSLVLRFLERNENPKMTIGLEYTYGRRTRGNNKDVGHLWELGGGSRLSSLLSIPLTPQNIEIASLVIVLDLTKPHELWITAEKLIEGTRARINDVLREVNRLTPTVHDRLLANAKARIAGHSDLTLCDPFPIPIAFVGAKYDEFQNFESDDRRQICKAMRFLAHHYAANLLFYSSKMENLAVRGRALLSHLAFSTANSKGISTDHNKPLFVPPGQDSFEDIGAPPLPQGSFTSLRASQPIALWREAINEMFPQKEAKEQTGDDLTEDPLFVEPQIDKLVEQKRRDLEMYVKQKRERQAAEERIKLKLK
ncbi:unnamed protein product, partial [Mesorhabditis belari]|uniref:Cytoplasmic dynein 2 light intermediate chain 1 n=1 Tax=Mesorhabditis belari TaxID=2138241 RepID=A0AAF3EG49_9BILA